MGIISQLTWSAERLISAASVAANKYASALRPPSTQLRQLQSVPVSSWTAGAIENALELHELGDFTESARLLDGFGTDDRISGCLNTRVRALVGKAGAGFGIQRADAEDVERAELVKTMVAKRWPQTVPEDVLTRVQRDTVGMGVSISRIHWIRERGTGGLWSPRLEPWKLEWCRKDQQRGCYTTYTDRGEVEVRPGTGEWLVVEPSGVDGYMAGGVRALSMPFFFRHATWRDWARYCEKHGVPMLAVEEPPAKADASSGDSRARFYAALKRAGREGILRLPRGSDGKPGFDAKFLEPQTLSWPSFEAFLMRLDTCIAVYLLGQNLSTEVNGGSYAAINGQNRVRLDYLAADAESLSTSIREQVWVPWGRFNFDWWDDELAAWPHWDTRVPEDQKAKADTLLALGGAVTQLKASGMKLDVVALAEQFGVPLIAEDDNGSSAATPPETGKST